jgi:DNA polymerase elongation subunit (family B)
MKSVKNNNPGYVVSFDFASLYPTTMSTYLIRNLVRADKMRTILESINDGNERNENG